MIIDTFLFCNELDMLEKRLEYLYDTVDLFLIVEADYTFVGNSKPLNFLNNRARYKKYLDKILYCPYSVDLSKYNFSTDNKEEFFRVEIDQRNHIGEMLKRFPQDTHVILSDVDEIPLKTFLSLATQNLAIENFDVIVLKCDMFYYNFDQKQVIPWWGPIVCNNSYIQKFDAQWARSNRVYNAALNNAGYHLGYWGDPNNIKYKIENFAHQEYNKEEFTNVENIAQRIAIGTDIFSRQAEFNMLQKVDVNTIDKEIYRIFSPIAGK